MRRGSPVAPSNRSSSHARHQRRSAHTTQNRRPMAADDLTPDCFDLDELYDAYIARSRIIQFIVDTILNTIRLILRPLPVVGLFCIVGYVYYAYAVAFCYQLLMDGEHRHLRQLVYFYLVVFHFLLASMLTSYLRAVISRPRLPKLPPLAHDLDAQGNAPAQSTATYCRTCRSARPVRAHHCRVCNACIPVYDHHCPWLGNCVGEHNRKMFVLFLIYICIGCTFMLTSVVATQAAIGRVAGSHAIITLSGVLCVVMYPFSAYHVYLVLTNRTTIEHAEHCATGCPAPRLQLGALDNWTQIMGVDRLLWFVPIAPRLPPPSVTSSADETDGYLSWSAVEAGGGGGGGGSDVDVKPTSGSAPPPRRSRSVW